MKTLPVSLKVRAMKGERFTVMIGEENEKPREIRKTTDEAPFVEFTDDYVVQEAEKSPTTVEKIRKAMESLGDTSFEAASVEIDADENIFIPVGVLKNARRTAADLLLEKNPQCR
ncbi:DUF3656 domain-containing protein [Methanosarcina barkeri]|uniref:DUF3656 domain-containing protein n=1 Tax=Methanosarcina barkeri TaxID=2208 RepID=UPI001FB55843|nr:DUF3656 domain-containing protein [Methanosarcina barkeri]